LKRAEYNILILIVCFLAMAGLAPTATAAKTRFTSYELELGYGEILFSDFNRDDLDDIIIINEPNLVFFFQDPKNGFTKTPNLVYSLGDKPSVIWPAKLGNNTGRNILVMTNDGISKLTYVDKTSPPAKIKIIDRQTIIPEKCENPPIIFFALSANTTEEFPLIFIPIEDELEIWKYDKQWQHAYSLKGTPDTRIWGPHKTAGYIKQYWLNMNIADLNGDKLDDLVICEDNNGKTLFNIYPQTKEGTFPPKPSQSFEDQWGWRKWICLQDINKDGNVDIIKNTWLQEAWFLPGADSGKVIVQIFLAGQNGNIPDEAQYIFRKSDWTPSMPIVDIDGDGFIDLVLGFGQFDSREGIRKAMTTKKLNHTLRFHFYGADNFEQNSDFETDISVHLGYRGPIFTSRAGRVESRTSLDGDFNGDGNRDLLVIDKADKASVYFFISREKGFSKKADMHFNIKRVKQLFTEDLNNDGVSDLIVLGYRFKVFLSKRK